MSPLFFDGAFGTYYYKLTGSNEPCEFANINDPDTVIKIHKQYLEAGALALRCNTFGVNSLLCENSEMKEMLIRRGYELACQACEGTQAVVYADIGYIGAENAQDEYKQLADLFIQNGAKHFIFETLAEYEPLIPALEAIKKAVPDAVTMVSFAAMPDGYTKKGLYYKDLIRSAVSNRNVNAVGMNCICGVSHLYKLITELDLAQITFSAIPNAGYPSTQNGRTIYQDNVDYFAEKLMQINGLGVRILGGCCGTTPEHISRAIQMIQNNRISEHTIVKAVPMQIKKQIRNEFKERLLSGKRVIALELDPPLDANKEQLISMAKCAAKAECDLLTVSDSPLARTRADSIITAAKLYRESGVPAMPHLSCRDKNHIAIKASLLGASMEGIQNIFAVTGDPITQTDRSEQKGVFSFNSYSLISFINSLNAETLAHNPLFIGGALNVNALRFDVELKRAEQKIKNGAGFMMTQPIFTDEALQNLKTAKQTLNCKILAGILPVAGYKNALFLNNEISGIVLPSDFIEQLKDKPRELAEELSVDFSMDIAHKIKNYCDGFYIMTPLNRIELVCRLIERIKKEI